MAKAQTTDDAPEMASPVAGVPVREASPPESASPAAQAAIGLLDRLENVLDDEANGLRAATVAEMKDINRRKSQCLLELTRASRALEGEARHPALAERIATLRGALDRNQSALGVHIAAVREIAAIISEAIRAHDSDGTYVDRPQLRADAPVLRSDVP